MPEISARQPHEQEALNTLTGEITKGKTPCEAVRNLVTFLTNKDFDHCHPEVLGPVMETLYSLGMPDEQSRALFDIESPDGSKHLANAKGWFIPTIGTDYFYQVLKSSQEKPETYINDVTIAYDEKFDFNNPDDPDAPPYLLVNARPIDIHRTWKEKWANATGKPIIEQKKIYKGAADEEINNLIDGDDAIFPQALENANDINRKNAVGNTSPIYIDANDLTLKVGLENAEAFQALMGILNFEPDLVANFLATGKTAEQLYEQAKHAPEHLDAALQITAQLCRETSRDTGSGGVEESKEQEPRPDPSEEFTSPWPTGIRNRRTGNTR